jgi:putative ABC transport system permease protein
MVKNFFKIAFRNIFRNKVYSFINIFGLSVGIACFTLIFLFVKDEISYDRFNKNADRIFRINAHYKIGENRFNMANSPAPLASVLKDEYPEVRNAVRLAGTGDVYVKKGEDYILEEKFLYADSSLFDVFTIDFVRGNPKTALTQPGQAVITTETAEKYFKGKNPVGERIILSDGKEFLITGVVNPLPHNSHFEFDFAASLNSLSISEETNWFGSFVHTYVLTDESVNAEQLNNKIFAVTEKHVGPIIKAAFNVTYKDFLKSGNDFSFVFVPLKDIHLFSYSVFNELKETGSVDTVYMFSAIALFILIIACINFINLSTAKSAKRANEIGVRKVLGSDKGQLIRQFLSESVIFCFIAVVTALMIIEIVLPYFNDLTGKDLRMDYTGNMYMIPGIILFTLLIGAAAGIYPAMLLASFKPVQVLKGKMFKGKNKNLLRKGLVVFQFATTIILFIGTYVIYNQMQYVKNKNLGYNKDQVMVIRNIENLGTQQFGFANSIKNYPGVINSTLSFGLPSHSLSANIFRKDDGSHEDQTLITIQADYNFLSAYDIKLKEGRYFSKDLSTDTLSILFNEAAVKKLGYTNPVNQSISRLEEASGIRKLSIIGVVKDFHLQSMKDEIRPAAIILLNKPEANYLSVKISAKNIQETIQQISSGWKEYGQINPLEYSFFDENFDELYRADIQTGKVFSIFSILAIVIACLGLFGLAAYTAEQRTKEIGIRKVLGSSGPQIFMLLSKEFIKWVVISNVIAWPAAYFIMNKWLDEFVYRVNIDISSFLLTGLAALIIAVLTISYQSVKAALANPVKSLKYE